MGVLACNRNDCENVMCDNYSHEWGYLCTSCKQELLETNGNMDISSFMKISKLDDEITELWKVRVNNTFREIED